MASPALSLTIELPDSITTEIVNTIKTNDLKQSALLDDSVNKNIRSSKNLFIGSKY